MKKILFTMLALILSLGIMTSTSEAAKKKDKKKPTVKLTLADSNWTRKSVQVNVSAKDKSGIKTLVWKQGKIKKSKASKWYGAKSIKKKKYFKAPANGWYSVKAVDKKGNAKIQNIKISTIDKQGPDGNVTYTVNNKVATMTVSASDPRGVASVKWAEGYINNTSASQFPNTVENNTFTGTQNGYYTVRLQDTLGNVSLKYVQVKLWWDLTEIDIFDGTGENVKCTIYDRWRTAYTNPFGIWPAKDGSKYAEWYLNGSFKHFSGKIVRGKGIEDDDIVWLEFLTDDTVVYTSEKMNYKSQPINFDISIRNAKYLKIRAYRSGGNYFDNYRNDSFSQGIYISNGQLYN